MDIEKRKADRLRVMTAVFDAANGSGAEIVRIVPRLQRSLGLTEREIMDAALYLIGEGLIVAPIKVEDDYIVGVRLTHQGVKEMEQSLQSPREPTRHFPPSVSIVNVQGNVIGSAIQSGSPGAQQEMSIGDLDLGAVREFLREYDAHAADLELSGPAADELAAEIDTVRAQLRSPKPKKHIIRESLVSVRIILEVTSGTAAAVGFLDLLKLVHL